MSINLVSRDFGTEVTTNSVCVDGYEVDNLLGRKGQTVWGQPQGFLAEPFIKPPVDVTFMFPFNVCLERIVIHPKVGSQASTGFEIFAASMATPGGRQCQWPAAKRGQASGRPHDAGEPELRTRGQMLAAKDSLVFASIGKAFSADRSSSSPSLFCFLNRAYRPMHPALPAVDANLQGDTPSTITRPLRHGQAGALTDASHLTVRVNSAPGGSIAIKYVRIFGQPSSRCSRPTVSWFLHIANLIQNPPSEKDCRGARRGSDKPTVAKRSGSDSKGKKGSRQESVADPAACPEDFIDPITNEMMVLPVLLPSGHTVDSETLRKHGEAEARWGRPPNDPFTGVPFAEGRKPLPNVKLKERLDRYLLKGGEARAPTARDVGRSSPGVASQDLPAPATLVRPQTHPATANAEVETATLHKCPPIKATAENHLEMSNQADSPLTVTPGSSAKRRRSAVSRAQNLPSKRKPKLDAQEEHSNDPTCDQRGPSGPSESTACSSRTHEQMLTQSLDNALEDALSSLPSFSRQPVRQCDKPTDPVRRWSCQSCGQTLATRDCYHVNGPLNMYKLPCSHLLCRACLLPGNSSAARRNCSVCNRTFQTAEVTKVHV